MTTDELREKNFEVVQKYIVECAADGKGGPDPSRHFAEDGFLEVPFTPTLEPAIIKGGAALKKLFDENAELFSDSKWHDTTYYQSTDPNMFWVSTFGTGKHYFTGKPMAYENRYFFEFKMEDGKIKELKEIFDPMRLVKYMGIELPPIPGPHDRFEK